MISHHTLTRMSSSGLDHKCTAEHKTLLTSEKTQKTKHRKKEQFLNVENTVDPLSAIKLNMSFKPCLLINLIQCSGINK